MYEMLHFVHKTDSWLDWSWFVKVIFRAHEVSKTCQNLQSTSNMNKTFRSHTIYYVPKMVNIMWCHGFSANTINTYIYIHALIDIPISHFFLHKWLKMKKSLGKPLSQAGGKLCTKCCISYIKRTLDSRTHEVSKGKKYNCTCINDWKWRSLSVNPSHGPVGNYVRNAAFRT